MILGTKDVTEMLKNASELEISKAISKGIKLVQSAARAECPVDHGELRGSIFTVVETEGRNVTGICYTDKKYGPYVEFGTGPKGQENHEGISPDTTPVYTQSPWWIHEGSGPNEVDRATAEKYGWFDIDTPEGRFYQCTGQPAQPFLYPALKNNEKQIEQVIREELRKQF